MDNSLDPVATGLLKARAFAEEQSSRHMRTFGLPMNSHALTHTMRSALQALGNTAELEGYELGESYLAFGRVELLRQDDQQRFLLKSRKAIRFETSYQTRLFDLEDEPGVQPTKLLLYGFDSDVLSFATVPCERYRAPSGRLKYQLLGEIIDAGVWAPHELPDVEPFDQGQNDDFGDLSEDIKLREESDE